MIKALGRTGAGQPLLILGLSGENMTRLMAGEPIKIDTAQEFANSHIDVPSLQIAVIGGRDENAIVASLKQAGLITTDTEDRSEPSASD